MENNFFDFMALAKELVTDNRPLRLRLDLPGGFNDDHQGVYNNAAMLALTQHLIVKLLQKKYESTPHSCGFGRHSEFVRACRFCDDSSTEGEKIGRKNC
ncbi:hypothetical protein FHW83_001980 [Duganella sp. SG902]|uniref:hypothetical protein n=1 Tax=Duganella sp. SG902 TaxID=2587016 RepID=UPI00159E7C09|nr:hypothetical protein [Duganella sp. SG902]NVM76185.1 hypothetical protein [Duganella sp. SG902]